MKTQDIFIARPTTEAQVSALKAFMQELKIEFEMSKEDPYNPEFVAKIKESRRQYKNGKYTEVKPDNLNEFMDSL